MASAWRVPNEIVCTETLTIAIHSNHWPVHQPPGGGGGHCLQSSSMQRTRDKQKCFPLHSREQSSSKREIVRSLVFFRFGPGSASLSTQRHLLVWCCVLRQSTPGQGRWAQFFFQLWHSVRQFQKIYGRKIREAFDTTKQQMSCRCGIELDLTPACWHLEWSLMHSSLKEGNNDS